MQPILDADGVAISLSTFRNGNFLLIFFVDGGDETARQITAILKSCSNSLTDRKVVVLATRYQSVLHLQFEAVYGPAPVNTVTFIARGGAAIIRWTGHGSIEDVFEEICEIDCIPDAELREFGYPSEEAVRDFFLLNPVDEETLRANGSASSLESVDEEIQPGVDEEIQPSVDKEIQPSVDKEMQPHEEKEKQPSGLSAKKTSPGQPKDQTVLQIRCPDGSSVTKTFKTSSLLSEVREVIATHLSSDEFGLATSFPRHHYVSEDYGRNLGELDLWPNAVLLIVPADPRQENNNTSLWSYTGNFSSWAYTFVMYMWNRISSFFPFTAGRNPQPEAHASDISDRQGNVQPGPSGSRRRSNIHTLRDTEKDDDKRRTTYNGNSTQQL